MLRTRLIPAVAGACQYPLPIENLMLSGRRYEKSHEIVYRNQIRYSYVTFNEHATRLASVLSEAEVRAGDTMAVTDWDSHCYLEYMFAIPMIGVVLHTISIRLSPEQILYTTNHTEDHFVLVNSESIPLYQAVAGQLATVERIILLTDDAEKNVELPGLVGKYELLLAAANPRYDFPGFDGNSIATTFHTIGTIGNPKGVRFSHRQLVLHTLAMASTTGSLDSICLLGTSDVYMPITPMSHVRAWGTPYVAVMFRVKRVYPGRYGPGLLVELQKCEKIAFSYCVLTTLQMVMNARAAQGVDFKGWKVIINGSALSCPLYEAAKVRGIQLTVAYGISETCPLISCVYLNDELLTRSKGEHATYRIKAGVPVPLVDAAVIDEQGRSLPVDGESQGELVLRSSWLTQEYLREPERGEKLWRDGRMHTGDMATLDGMNFIEIRDRIKDVVKTDGEWLSSLELEGLISRYPAVREVAVVRVPDPQWGEHPFILLVVREGQQLDACDLKKHLKPFVEQDNIDKWAIPSQVAVVTDIPKASVGELDRRRIRIEIAQW